MAIPSMMIGEKKLRVSAQINMCQSCSNNPKGNMALSFRHICITGFWDEMLYSLSTASREKAFM